MQSSEQRNFLEFSFVYQSALLQNVPNLLQCAVALSRYWWRAITYLKAVTASLGDEINCREADFPLEVQQRTL